MAVNAEQETAGLISPGNCTVVTEFMFLAFPTRLGLQALHFTGISLVFAATVAGNLLILVAIQGDTRLHTPMYLFLEGLSVIELSYVATIFPQMLVNALQERKSITFGGCGAQMFFFIGLGSSDCFLLVAMAYDRYVAICRPLHYTRLMTRQLCLGLVAASLALGGLLSLQIAVLIFRLPFCGSNMVNHFLCDVNQVLKLASTDTHSEAMAQFIASVLVVALPFLLICVSYIYIINTILSIHSAEGRRRTFQTCSSHLMVVLLQYSSCGLVYLHPKGSWSDKLDQLISLGYIFGSPIFNPLIYSLRNKELKEAIAKVIRR
ncbi:olfactory receptor 10W1-like [Emydura macquarii macquarii]|uniref:olfactory receptor 10W1-like n=1 Tax=Emydura macquarii macquarii TaxID=1129001 RepID=UPI00352A82CB